jgi:4-amino-4-deoxy-L-arabinose transferase-like glycosyltransferase
VTVQLHIRRRARAQAPFLLILAVFVAVFGYLTISPDHWRRAVSVLAGGMLLAAILRLVLPSAHAGLLAVRGRWWDALCYIVLGVLILIVDIRLQH